MKTPVHSLLWSASFALLASGCDSPSAPESEATETGSASETGAVSEQVTYTEHVRPLLTKHCASCHQDGEIGPFALDTYEGAREYGPAIAAAVATRTMPPVGIDNSGSCNTFEDASWLTEEEIELVTAWVDAGYPEGDASIDAPPVPEPAVLKGEGIEDVGFGTYRPVPQTEPGAEHDDYQCFKIEVGKDTSRYLTGFEVLADNKALVHHVVGFRVDPSFAQNGALMDELDAASPDQPGWDCYGGPGEGIFPGGAPVTWAPGTGATTFPEGTGIEFAPGDVLVLQMHYHLDEHDATDATQLRLQWADSVEREAYFLLDDGFLYTAIVGNPDELAPGQENVSYSWTNPIADMLSFYQIDYRGDFDLLGIFPHMHTRGTTMSVEVDGGGHDLTCAVEVDRWDFDWQRAYYYSQPIAVHSDDRVKVTCNYDTTGDDEPVLPGFATTQEMCLVGLLLVESE